MFVHVELFILVILELKHKIATLKLILVEHLATLAHCSSLFLQIAKTFREKNIPCDVIWMDIDYMDGFRCFTFDKASFSFHSFP